MSNNGHRGRILFEIIKKMDERENAQIGLRKLIQFDMELQVGQVN
ncbi:hypothetical protein GcM1_174011 [Golovinomyces cichoracearum]|uniref:Uncharacterized protein n=1 Tax=Golovinomyces cichoracearum TaxID=62708 RepID=A0A420J5U7_9PEZI|nr:hypothetical protein GcM1_174011 [Golovinomyces cichoracearum]